MSEESSNFVATGIEVHGFVSRFVEDGVELLQHGVNVQGSECGVYGESQDLTPDMSTPRTNTTRSTPFARIGVYGVGDTYGVYGDNGVHGKKHGDEGYGVSGEGGKVGVYGEGHAAGVEGRSDAGVGGLFGSIRRAQLRLQPSPADFEVPAAADTGDIFFSLRRGEPLDSASLWICVYPTSSEIGGAERWREIQLGPVQKQPIRLTFWQSIFSRLPFFPGIGRP